MSPLKITRRHLNRMQYMWPTNQTDPEHSTLLYARESPCFMSILHQIVTRYGIDIEIQARNNRARYAEYY